MFKFLIDRYVQKSILVLFNKLPTIYKLMINRCKFNKRPIMIKVDGIKLNDTTYFSASYF